MSTRRFFLGVKRCRRVRPTSTPVRADYLDNTCILFISHPCRLSRHVTGIALLYLTCLFRDIQAEPEKTWVRDQPRSSWMRVEIYCKCRPLEVELFIFWTEYLLLSIHYLHTRRGTGLLKGSTILEVATSVVTLFSNLGGNRRFGGICIVCKVEMSRVTMWFDHISWLPGKCPEIVHSIMLLPNYKFIWCHKSEQHTESLNTWWTDCLLWRTRLATMLSVSKPGTS
jgi:hypothetical protein